jgi:hypothetical protein
MLQLLVLNTVRGGRLSAMIARIITRFMLSFAAR